MNQILEPKSDKSNLFDSEVDNNRKNSKVKLYWSYFIIFSFISFLLLVFLFFRIYFQSQNEDLSKKLINQYTVSRIYLNELDYSISLPNIESNSAEEPFVIGMIKIDKIDLNYPILSSTTNELLDISLCRFAGPMPNEVGNLCIAGHNYVDYKLFSRLYELDINDKIKIYDLNGNMIEYIVFDIYETNPDDISCTTQDTNNNKIITLLTCNNVNGKRLVVVAIEQK